MEKMTKNHIIMWCHWRTAKSPSHQRDDPGKDARQPGIAHGGVHAEAGDGLEQEGEEREEVGEPGERSCVRSIPSGRHVA